MSAAAWEAGKGMFAAGIMVALADVAASIAGFVAVEVVEALFAAAGHGTVVAVMGIVAVIDVSVEVFVPVEPGAGANEHAALKPVRTVVAIRGAVVGSVIEVPVDRKSTRLNSS